ncbi:MAG TPA: protein translocase subunit SecF [Methanothermobacter sp.]|nr:preprotein translocase subunit SecF [Methanothermobacter sp. MT-2]HHW05305.1 protein translocase subunit SecF [Methanothermobacter sp.]HOK72917.1 protein translocase subunit SecF [Methanothermobacter sp.]HOL68997.1 protein translocase subunit SecF [Methanothermobacter sp.]HPQ04866.1 protein translocase subunit SecF [Methanothermobacter sp.]
MLTRKFIESYKALMIIPLLVTLLALGIIFSNGLEQSVDLKGGSITEITLEKKISQTELKSLIEEKLNIKDVNVVSITGSEATVQMGSEVQVDQFANALEGTAKIKSYKSVGPILSKEAMKQIYWAVGFAFLFMSITVLIVFRNLVPSLAVIMAALCDIIIALGGMSAFKIPLSLASIGAILMLIGYSVDTDILLTTRLLKQKKGKITERAIGAMKTGITMSAAAIAAMGALYIVTVFIIPEAEVLSNIAAVLIIGLSADIITTWLMNLGILRWYLEAKQ